MFQNHLQQRHPKIIIYNRFFFASKFWFKYPMAMIKVWRYQKQINTLLGFTQSYLTMIYKNRDDI